MYNYTSHMQFQGLRAWGVGCASQALGVETAETLHYEGRRRLLGGAFGRWGEAIRNRPGCRLPDVLLELSEFRASAEFANASLCNAARTRDVPRL
jgi:hypothetical protein